MSVRKYFISVCLVAVAGCAGGDDARGGPDGGTGCIGCVGGEAGFGNAITSSAGTAAVSGTAGVSGDLGPGDISTGEAGTTATLDGSAGTGEEAVDAGAGLPSLGGGPCPTGFVCFTDPLLGVLHACLKGGGPLPLPVECMTDADCVAAGLPMGTCVSEEETGLNGCMQLCTPDPVDPPDAGM